jgi:hypothetical protein
MRLSLDLLDIRLELYLLNEVLVVEILCLSRALNMGPSASR